MTKEENEALMYACDEDIKFYQKCEEGLYSIGGINGTGKDEDGIPIPYHCGPHSVRCLRGIVDIVKPKSIFEIGFNCGHSSSMWLNLSEAKVLSCDISEKKETLNGVEVLRKKYPKRFAYFKRGSDDFFNYLQFEEFSLIFIDGAHELEFVIEDIKLALELKIPYIAMDDWLIEFGQIQEAVATFGDKLEVVNVNGNIALLKNKAV